MLASGSDSDPATLARLLRVLVDLHMLVLFGARERTHAEYDALLDAAGLAPSTLAPSPNTWSVLVTGPTAG